MTKGKEDRGFMDIVSDGLSAISKMIAASIFPHLADGAEMVMDTIDDRIVMIEDRILKKASVLLLTLAGAAFLVFALLFYLKESLRWTTATACFAIGICLFVAGLMMKVKEAQR